MVKHTTCYDSFNGHSYKELQPIIIKMSPVKNNLFLFYRIGFILVMFALFLLTGPLPISRAIDIDGTTGSDTIVGTVNDDDIRGRSGVDNDF